MPNCILSVPGTAKRHSVTTPTNQSTSSFSAWVRNARSCRLLTFSSSTFFVVLAPQILPTEQPESTPRVPYPTTHTSADCRIDFAVVCRVVFKLFPCGLWVGLGLPSPNPNRSPSQRTALAGRDSSQPCEYPKRRYSTGFQPAPRGGESRRRPTDCIVWMRFSCGWRMVRALLCTKRPKRVTIWNRDRIRHR